MAPIAPTKIVCIGRNYAAHAAELGNQVPTEPLIFLKPPSAIIGAGEAIILPTGVGQVHFEGEIGVVIGKRARHVSREKAWDYVGALVPVNDVTARDLQKKDGQWTRAKGFDTFCPVGTPVPVAGIDLKSLAVTTTVNGKVRQHAPVTAMVFDIAFLMAHVTRIMTLEPGDLICTGTPDGIGALAAGDEVEVRVAGVGSVKNTVREEVL